MGGIKGGDERDDGFHGRNLDGYKRLARSWPQTMQVSVSGNIQAAIFNDVSDECTCLKIFNTHDVVAIAIGVGALLFDRT